MTAISHPGAKLAVRAGVALGALSPDDVIVEVLYGRTGEDDEIIDPVRSELMLESPPGPVGRLVQRRGDTGAAWPFGYTVRVLPRHPLLAARPRWA